MEISMTKLDLSQSGIDQWKNFNQEDRLFWKSYFDVRSFDRAFLQSFEQYAHDYGYCLKDDEIERTIFCVIIEILRYNKLHGMHRAFFGNSGGLDSAIICGLLSRTSKLSYDLGIPFDVVSYGLPISSNPDHNLRATQTAQTFGVRHITIQQLDDVLETFKKNLLPLCDTFQFTEEEKRRALGNVKARLRMIVNFFGTAQPGSYVVSTDNLSELYMAFWTLMGDVGAFGPIQNILKGLELPAVAYALGVPEHTLRAKPTDGLNIHTSLDKQEGGDVDAFQGVRYPHLDAIICHATSAGLDLEKPAPVHVDATHIDSIYASQEVVDRLIAQMVSPSAVWKRTKGSIGMSITRNDLGLPSLSKIQVSPNFYDASNRTS
jgi:NAD+ synthetase